MRRKGSKVDFLDYWPFRYLCQDSFLTSLAVLTWSGVSRKTVWLWLPFTNAENQILKFSNSWNHWKFRRISSIGQLNVIRKSGVLKTGLSQDAWKEWGLKPLSKQYWSRFTEICSGNRRSRPISWTYRPNQVVPHYGRSTHESAPPLKGALLTPALKEIWWTRAERLLQWHSENGHKNILFMDEKFFTIN